MMDEEGGRRYCVCQSRDTGQLMICCDKCQNWFHGGCVQISAHKAKLVKTFYCPACCHSDPSLQIQFHKKKEKKAPEEEATPRCGQCIGCFRNDNCGRCDACKKGHGCRLRVCVNAALLSKDAPEAKKRGRQAPKKAGRPGRQPKLKNVSGRGGGARYAPKPAVPPTAGGLSGTRSNTKAYQQFMKEAGLMSSSDDDEGRQCIGPGCTNEARKHSKYCGDECGLRMAKRRLAEFLPEKLLHWRQTPSMADTRQKERLEAIRVRQEGARAKLTQLDAQEKWLNKWIERLSELRSKEEDEGTAEEMEADDQNIYCVTCGLEIASRTALKHMIRCFSKYEGQTSYGSTFKTNNNLYNLFCDAFNKTNRTYCKRLRVICPEHSKDSRPRSEEEVCGNPAEGAEELATPADDTTKVCLTAKKKCTKHYHWEKLRRGSIDMERLAQLLKLDELFEEERALRMAMASRGGVPALLLHSTIAHHPQTTKPPNLP